jgi:hypothetical protein
MIRCDRLSSSRRLPLVALAFLPLLGVPSAGVAQKDYYNTDRNRPVRVEDAYPTERYALELKVAPLRLERETGGVYHWGLEPELAYGLLPRTSLELGVPIAVVDRANETGRRSGLAGLELSVLHNLNVETRTLPAFGLRADLFLPVGGLAGSRAYPALTGLATRTFTWARVHLNAQYTFGSEPDDDDSPVHEPSRWLAGVAVDRSFPLQSWLLIGEVYAAQPLNAGEGVAWTAGSGIRYQLTPYLALDGGIGRRLTGQPQWFVTFGSAYHVGVRALMPRFRQEAGQ